MAPPMLEELADAVRELDDVATTKATSVRLPTAVHRATILAVGLGMDGSFTAATAAALSDRIRVFLRQRAMSEHLERFPTDRPALAAVARRRIQGTGHPAERRPELVARVAEQVERREPRWLETAIDTTVDLVLDHVELLLEHEEQGAAGAA